MTQRAFHVSLRVSDIPRSVAFYEALLGSTVTKQKDDYAKFEVAEPPLVLSLEKAQGIGDANAGRLSHLGFRVGDGDGIREAFTRLATGGFQCQFMQGVVCCYARQSKIAATDPDGNLVEVYVHEADVDDSAPRENIAAAAPAEVKAERKEIAHLVGSPLALPLADATATASHVALRGTFNDGALWETRTAVLEEARRVLARSGELEMHMLVADVPLEGPIPKLPPPAEHVNFVPALSRVLEALELAGFGNIRIERLSAAPVFSLGPVGLRELLLKANPPADFADVRKVSVVYRGPLKSVVLDDGTELQRGRPTAVSPSQLFDAPENVRAAFVAFADA